MATSAQRDRWLTDVSALVRDGLQRRVAGHDPADLGSAAELAARMLAAVPEPSPWNALGPFYSTTGVRRILGGISRQAVEDRRRRGRLIALHTAEGGWVYPAFQFDGRNRPMAAVVDAHRRLTSGRIDAWSAAGALVGPQPELGGRSIVEHLRDGGDPAVVEELVAATVASLA